MSAAGTCMGQTTKWSINNLQQVEILHCHTIPPVMFYNVQKVTLIMFVFCFIVLLFVASGTAFLSLFCQALSLETPVYFIYSCFYV